MQQNTGKIAKTQPNKRKMQNMQTISARKKGKSGKSGGLALTGVALGDMEDLF